MRCRDPEHPIALGPSSTLKPLQMFLCKLATFVRINNGCYRPNGVIYQATSLWNIVISVRRSNRTAMLVEVGRRYVEQLETTVETMRRRCLAMYDGTCSAAGRAAKLGEKARDVVEPMAYDLKDYVRSATSLAASGPRLR